MLNENSRACSVGFSYDQIDEAENPDAPGRKREEKTRSLADQLEFARWLISFIRSQEDCRITVDCIFLALGDLELDNLTMTRVADYHGLTKAAISKRTKGLRRKLNIGVNANNKSQRASRRYALTNLNPFRLICA